MRTSHRIVAAACLGLLVAMPQLSAGAASERVPGEARFHLRMLGDSYQNACSSLALTPADGPDGASCSFPLLKILPPCPQDPTCEQEAPPLRWRSGGLTEPLVLDASRDVSGVIAFSSWHTAFCDKRSCTHAPQVGVGVYRLIVSLQAEVDGSLVTVGSTETSYEALPNQDFVFDYGIDVPDALDYRVARSLTLSVRLRGQGAMHGIVETERTNPLIDVPVFLCPADREDDCA